MSFLRWLYDDKNLVKALLLLIVAVGCAMLLLTLLLRAVMR